MLAEVAHQGLRIQATDRVDDRAARSNRSPTEELLIKGDGVCDSPARGARHARNEAFEHANPQLDDVTD
jgi:hypothetical protein